MHYVLSKFKKDLNEEQCFLGDVRTKLTEKDVKRIFGCEHPERSYEVTANTARLIQEVDKNLLIDLNVFDYQIFPHESTCLC